MRQTVIKLLLRQSQALHELMQLIIEDDPESREVKAALWDIVHRNLNAVDSLNAWQSIVKKQEKRYDPKHGKEN